MGKDFEVKIKLEMNGQKYKAQGWGVILLTDEDKRVGLVAGGLLEPVHIAEAMIRHAVSREEGNDLMRDLVTQIMIQGCQEQDLVDSASFTLETARMIRDVLGQGGDEE